MTAPRDPAAGATPAREETALVDALIDAAQMYHATTCDLDDARAEGVAEESLDWFAVRTARDALAAAKRALHAALRERDAAREDAARLTDTEEATINLVIEAATMHHSHRDVLRGVVDRLGPRAAAEGRTP